MTFGEIDICLSTWRFSREDGRLIAPVLRFLPEGIVGGYIHESERCWSFDEQKFVLKNIFGQTTTVFDDYSFEDGNLSRMTGRSRIDPTVVHVLERVSMPSARDFGQTVSDDVPVFTQPERPARPRRNLVVLRANGQSLHTQWPVNIDDADRNWDLLISWYGREVPAEMPACEYFTHQPNDRKFSAIYKLFLEDSPFLDYENIYLPDDDLMTSWGDINKLFNIFRMERLELAQPSLVPSSYVTHPVTAQSAEFFLRYTNFVELMCPVFTRAAFRTCLPTFEASFSGFGLDHIWSLLLGRIPGRIAIIDDIAVAHTRPPNQSYNVIEAILEEHKMAHLYQSTKAYDNFGGIVRGKVAGIQQSAGEI